MQMRDVLIWTGVGIFVIVPAVMLARWRVIAARKLVARLVSDLTAKGEQVSEKDRQAFVAQLMLSGWKTRLLTLRIQGHPIPETYLREWGAIEHRIKRLRLVGIIIGVAILIALKTFVLAQ
jgi:hypothetical protein